ncbi:hypothetical protein, partial [Curtobacterium luteum]|uniref:hypothetical protein n=1 Tax=Curtobacterium luteum TaxID=33881 RepID=UPI003809A4E9
MSQGRNAQEAPRSCTAGTRLPHSKGGRATGRSTDTAKELIMRKSLKTTITLATTGALVLGGAAF